MDIVRMDPMNVMVIYHYFMYAAVFFCWMVPAMSAFPTQASQVSTGGKLFILIILFKLLSCLLCCVIIDADSIII